MLKTAIMTPLKPRISKIQAQKCCQVGSNVLQGLYTHEHMHEHMLSESSRLYMLAFCTYVILCRSKSPRQGRINHCGIYAMAWGFPPSGSPRGQLLNFLLSKLCWNSRKISNANAIKDLISIIDFWSKQSSSELPRPPTIATCNFREGRRRILFLFGQLRCSTRQYLIVGFEFNVVSWRL